MLMIVVLATASNCSNTHRVSGANTSAPDPQIYFRPLTLTWSSSGTLIRGSWVSVTEGRTVYPNTADIWCDPRTRECSVVWADYMEQESGLKTILLSRNSLEIVHYGGDQVVAKTGTEQHGVTLTINVPTNDVLWFETNPGYKSPDGDQSPYTMTMRLVDGATMWKQMQEQAQ